MAPPTRAQADIYRYVDSQGTVHFSNVPTNAKYEVYIRETHQTGVQPWSNHYDSFIAEAARKYSVAFSLVKAIIKVESNFDPYAVWAYRLGSKSCALRQVDRLDRDLRRLPSRVGHTVPGGPEQVGGSSRTAAAGPVAAHCR